jgi:S-layer homology domain
MAYQPKSYRKFLAGSVSAALVASAVGPVVANAASFSDVDPNSTHGPNILALADKGYIKGFQDGTFKPFEKISRGQAAKIFARILEDLGFKAPEKLEQVFDDVPLDAKDQELVKAAAIVKAAGVMTGSEGKLNPASNITRQQMAKVIVETFDLEKPADFKSQITDLDKADDWAREYIQTLEANGVTVVKEYRPKDNVTRGEFATFIKRAMDAQQAPLEIVQVNAVNLSKITVKFNQPVDEVKAENFSIAGLTVNAATLSEDKQTVTLSVSGAEVSKEYTLVVSGVKVKGEVAKEVKATFKTPSQDALYNPTIDFKNPVLKADGASSTLVTFKLLDAEGNLLTDAKDVVVAFSTTFGNFAQKRVTVQNGVATVQLTSEALTSDKYAEVTAQVIEAQDKNLIGLKAVGTVLMTPNPDQTEVQAGALMTDAEAYQADRVVAYFNKDVKVSDFVTANGAIDPAKASIEVWTNVNNDLTGGTKLNVVGLLPVQGNSKALQLVLDKNTVLTDNANVLVKFTDNRFTAKVPSTKVFKLTDARKPELLSVTNEGLKTLKVVFSEPVNEATAEKLENWSIDGKPLSSGAWGVNPTVSVGDFDPKTGVDTRHVVTITLGKDATGNQVYFKSGTHSLQAANIGDYAQLTDKFNNLMDTQTLDFTIPVDNTVPTATVEVQSPEQYLVTFNTAVNEDAAAFASKLELQKYNNDTKQWEKYTGQELNVVKVEDNKFLVEVKKDWTVVYDTAKTQKNYYNDQYRLFIPKDAVTAGVNGKKNEAIALELNGAMDAPDFTSPTISTMTEFNADDPGAAYYVTFSEPVKIPGVNDEGDTASQSQTNGVPTPIVEFVKKDNSVTVKGKIDGGFVDAYDKVVKVVPVDPDGNPTKLAAGDWTLVVRSVSDDIGNTTPSATKDFTVKAAPAADQFKVTWAVADFDGDLDNATTVDGDSNYDYIFIKFSKAVALTGDYKNALKTSNYTLNGANLPQGTQIFADIQGYKDDTVDVVDSITIRLPEGTITDPSTTVINIGQYIESDKGEVLVNAGEHKLPIGTKPALTKNN